MRCATKSLTIRQSKWLSRTTARRTEARKAARKVRKRLTTLLPTRQWRATPTHPEDDADDTPDYRLNISNHSADDKVLEPIITSESTLIDYLTEQINEHDLSEKQQQIADYIIGSIDDNGYLTRSVSAISDDLIFQEGLDVTDGEINTVLQAIRELDPAGWRRSTCATVCCCSWNGCLERPKTYMPTRLSTNISPSFQKNTTTRLWRQ